MRLKNPQGTTHLTYCLNIHPGESLEEIRRAIAGPAAAVRDRVPHAGPFGLGLRLPAGAAAELAGDAAQRRAFRRLLDEQSCYAFTVNAFPFGRFHDTRVKEQVYAPDWRTPERVAYTNQVADLLAEWMPDDGTEGSISTVPGSFKAWLAGEDDVAAMARRLLETARHLDGVRERTGRVIRLALEPEPDCFLESTLDAQSFFEWIAARLEAAEAALLQEYVGVCLDTCHHAVGGELPLDALNAMRRAGIRVPKIQLSAAPVIALTSEGLAAARRFDESTYLHQARAFRAGKRVGRWPDLPQALAAVEGGLAADQLRIHAHVPLFWEGVEPLTSTTTSLTPDFWANLAGGVCGHLEIETYTFGVLPPEFRNRPVEESIAREYVWVLARLGA